MHHKDTGIVHVFHLESWCRDSETECCRPRNTRKIALDLLCECQIFPCGICPCIPPSEVKIKDRNMPCFIHSLILVFTMFGYLEVSRIQKCGSLPCGWFGGCRGIPTRTVPVFTDEEYSYVSVKWLHTSRWFVLFSHMEMRYMPLVMTTWSLLMWNDFFFECMSP